MFSEAKIALCVSTKQASLRSKSVKMNRVKKKLIEEKKTI